MPGVFVESDDRIFSRAEGEIKRNRRRCPPTTRVSSVRSVRVLNAPDNEVRSCLRIVDSTGKVLWDLVAVGQAVPRAPTVRTGDQDQSIRSEAPRVGGGQTKNVIYVFSNDGKQLLKTLGVEGETAGTHTSASHRTWRFYPTAACSWRMAPPSNARVVKLDKNGRFVSAFGSHGSGDSQFNAVHESTSTERPHLRR